MSEEEIIKNIEDMLLHAETNLLDYEALALQGLLDLYIAEKEKNKELEHRLKNNVISKYCIRKMKEEKMLEFRNAHKPEIFREILFLNKLLKVKNEE